MTTPLTLPTITRRSLLSGAAALATATALGGCGGSPGGGSGPITVLGQGAAWTKGDFYWTQIQKFMTSHSGSQVDIVSAGQKFQQLFSSQIASGSFPDVMAGGLDLPLVLEHDWVKSLDSDLGLADLQDRFPKQMWIDGITTADGHIYSLTSLDNRGVFLEYNTALLKKAGLDPDQPPTTWAELITMAEQVTEKVPGTVGLTVPLKTQNGYGFVSNSFQGSAPTVVGGFDYAQGRYVNDLHTPTIELLVKLQESGALHPDAATLDAAQSDGTFSNGKAAFGILGPWAAAVNSRAKLTEYGLTTLPTDGGEPLQNGTLAGGMLWVSKDNDNSDLAKELIDFLTSTDVQQAVVTDLKRPGADADLTIKSAELPQLSELAKIQQAIVQPPVPTAADPKALAVQKTEQSLAPPRTDWWQIAQGVLAGKVPDWEEQLASSVDAMNARFDKALAKEEADRSLFTFPDWDGRSDFPVKSSIG